MLNSFKEQSGITFERIIAIYNKGTYITDLRRGSIPIPGNEFDEFKKWINNTKYKKKKKEGKH